MTFKDFIYELRHKVSFLPVYNMILYVLQRSITGARKITYTYEQHR